MAEHSHGHSVAAWTAVTIILVGSALACLAVVVVSWPLAIVSIIVMLVGAAAGPALARAGYGQHKPEKPQGTTAIR